MSMMQSPEMTLSNIAKAHPDIIDEMRPCDPIKTASMFAALLTEPELQASCLSLEVLVALATMSANGSQKPTKKQVARWFSNLNQGLCGMMLDPSEDSFTSSIALDDGDYLIFPGIWEGAAFYTQVMLDALDGVVPERVRAKLLSPIRALLKLSDEIARRQGLSRNEYGESEPVRILPKHLAEQARRQRSLVCFSQADLMALAVTLDDLSAFGFVPEYREQLDESVNGNSLLDRYPLAYKNEQVVVLLPSAITAAIRLYIFEFFSAQNAIEECSALIAYSYSSLFDRIGIFGEINNSSLNFQQTQNGLISTTLREIDTGRWLNIICIVDPLDGFELGGLVDLANDVLRFDEDINTAIDAAHSTASASSNFKEMITLSVGCGIGRAVSHDVTAKTRLKWRMEMLSAYDLATISQSAKSDPLLLWRLLDARDAANDNGVTLFNMNGLVNLLAWSQRLKGHLIPHSAMPENFHSENTFVTIEQNALKKLRHEVSSRTDRRSLINPYGERVLVRKVSDNLFKMDNDRPVYAEEVYYPGRGTPLVYISDNRVWWAELDTPNAAHTYAAYARWELIKTWLPKIALVLDKRLTKLPDNLLWHSTFIAEIGNTDAFSEFGSFDGALRGVTFKTAPAKGAIYLTFGDEFERGIYNAENVAERAMISQLVTAFFELADESLEVDEKEKLVWDIVGNAQARQTHRYTSMQVRDRIKSELPRELIDVHALDEGALKLGLGWRFHDRDQGDTIIGINECTQFLRKTVEGITSDLSSELKGFSKVDVLRACLINHEVAAAERNQWNRTSGAVLALRNFDPDVRDIIIRNSFKLNAIFAASRWVAEMALCECPMDSGLKPSKLDISHMLSKAMLIFHLGGISDSIRWGAITPKLKITPQGDIHANHDFQEEIIEPFAQSNSIDSLDESIRQYAENIGSREPQKANSEVLGSDFLKAFKNEFGASVDEVRIVVESVEDRAIVSGSVIIEDKLSKLSTVATDLGTVEANKARAILRKLMLTPRASWDVIPEGCLDKDIRFWRFRRQLSIVRRPFLAFSNEQDPLVMIAPGMLRDSFRYIMSNYYSARFPIEQLTSKLMRKYKSDLDGKRGQEFEIEVKQQLDQLGWRTLHAKNVSDIFGKPMERNFGDVDLLAMSPDKTRLLVIECKDMLDSMTPGEIAEQMSKFQGTTISGKRDLLRKHLDRLELFQANPSILYSYCGVSIKAKIEGWLVFRNNVPMQWAWDELEAKTKIATLGSLGDI